MDHTDFESWLEAYGRAWESRDPTAAAALFAQDGTYQETPFVEPMRGRDPILEYWSNVARTQEDIRVGFEILEVNNARGIARWRASFLRLPHRIRMELDGIFLITLDSENRCTSLREWWHRKETTPSDGTK